MSTTVKGGLVVGAEVKNMPLIVEVQTSLFEEAVKRGEFVGTFAEFLSFLSANNAVPESLINDRVDAAVAKALKQMGTMPGQPGAENLAETIKAEVEKAAAKFSGGSRMPGVYVLNDLLPPEIAADLLRNDPIYPERHSAEIQKAYDALAPNDCRVCLYGKIKATKLAGYRPEWYGQDNQPVPGRPDLVRHGAQPTLVIHGEGVTLDLTGCLYEVQDMYLDGIHLGQGNAIHGGYFRTKRIHEIDPDFKVMDGWRGGITGSKGSGKDWIPMIDADTGFAAKGTRESGFNSTVSNNSDQYSTPYELGGHRSNSIDTSKLSSGGYPSASGKAFPQDDGTTSATWGTWGGGWHGNSSAAIVIFTMPGTRKHIRKNGKVEVKNTVIRGWIGSGIEVGLNGTLDGAYLGNSDFSQSDPLVPHNILLENNLIMDNYIGGIHKNRYVNLTERGNRIFRMGHPDFSLYHKNRGATGGNSIDPGYGSSGGRSLPQYGLLIENCVIVDCARKAVDAHTGTDTLIKDSTLKGGLCGISIAIEERHSNPREDSSAGVQVCKYVVRDCSIGGGIYALHVINGSLSERNSGTGWQYRTNFLVDGCIIRGPRPYFNNYGRGGFTLRNIAIVFDLPYGLPSGSTQYSAIYLGSENPGNRGIPLNATLENIEIMNSSKGNFAEGFVFRDINKLTVHNMTIHTQPYKTASKATDAWAGEENMVRSGTRTIPVKVITKPLVLVASGNTAFDASRQVHTVLDAEMGVTGTGGVVDNGGGVNPLVPNPQPDATGEAVSSGVVQFGGGTIDTNWAATSDGRVVIGKTGTLEPANFTLIKTVDIPDGASNVTSSPPQEAPTSPAGSTDGGTNTDSGGGPAPSPQPSSPVSPDIGEPVTSGIVAFDGATFNAESVVTSDNRIRVIRAGILVPEGYTLTTEREI